MMIDENALRAALAFFTEKSKPYPSPFAEATAREFLELYKMAEQGEYRAAKAVDDGATDLNKCPRCGGPADNGHDRCIPPSPYLCTKCTAKAVGESPAAPATSQPIDLAQLSADLLAILNRPSRDTTRMQANEVMDLFRPCLRQPVRESGEDVAKVIQAASALGGYADSARDMSGTIPQGWFEGLLQKVDKYFEAARKFYAVAEQGRRGSDE